jgi:hypothetical protein
MIILPPAVPDKTNNCKRHEHQVQYAGIQTLCRFFAKLLRRLGTHSALRLQQHRRKQQKAYKEYDDPLFHHELIVKLKQELGICNQV